MPGIIGPQGKRRRFYVNVYHQNQHVSEEPILAHNFKHAHQLAAYIAPTVAREAIHPRDFDRSRVHFQVVDPRNNEQASTPTETDNPTRRG